MFKHPFIVHLMQTKYWFHNFWVSVTALKLWDALTKKAKTEVGRKLLCICHLLLSHPNCIQNRGQRTSSSKRIRVTWEGTSEYKMDAQGVAWQPAAGMLLCLLSPRIWRISRSPCLALSFTPPPLHSSALNVELFPTVPNCNSIHSAMSDGGSRADKKKDVTRES